MYDGIRHTLLGATVAAALYCMDDYACPGNTVRDIDSFVDDLDVEDAGLQSLEPKATACPGYDPADLLERYVYEAGHKIANACKDGDKSG